MASTCRHEYQGGTPTVRATHYMLEENHENLDRLYYRTPHILPFALQGVKVLIPV